MLSTRPTGRRCLLGGLASSGAGEVRPRSNCACAEAVSGGLDRPSGWLAARPGPASRATEGGQIPVSAIERKAKLGRRSRGMRRCSSLDNGRVCHV
ncbi:hypothetical protein MTO96_031596 [Rhipicephalus appendiculatus]